MPIHHFLLEDVWVACGASGADLDRRRALWRAGRLVEALDGWPAHPAYVMGASRLSCALCVLAKRSDLIVGARHNRPLLTALRKLEDESGQSFQPRLWLREIEAEIENGSEQQALALL